MTAIPFIGFILGYILILAVLIFWFVMWLMGIIHAASGNYRTTPVFGKAFNRWFAKVVPELGEQILRQAQARDIAIVASGPDLPPEVPNLPPGKLMRLPPRRSGDPRVWHARRNVEMVAGLALLPFLHHARWIQVSQNLHPLQRPRT